MKGIIVVNAGKCLGCKSCEMACAVEHSASKELAEAIRETPAPRARVSVRGTGKLAAPLQCRQCENAPCVRICPTHALHRSAPDAPVAIRHEACIGCTLCVLACPFGVIGFDEGRRCIVKCDQCVERLARGEQPACVTACPTGSLRFQRVDEVLEEKRRAYLVQIENCVEAEREHGG